MADSDSKAIEASESPSSSQPASLGPLEGGQWRPVKPEELLRKSSSPVSHLDAPDEEARPKPRVELHRRQQLEHHLKSNPTDLESFLELGQIYRSEERPLEARRVLQQAVDIFPDEPKLLWELEEATLARSLQQLREVTDLANRLQTAETERELNRCQQDWASRRIEVCRARLQRDPSLSHLHIVIVEAMYDAGMYEEAVKELEQPCSNDELAPAANLLKGKCLLAVGNDLEAMAALRACAIQRAIPAPLRTKVMALRLLCETADRLGITLTLSNYRKYLQQAEEELSKQNTLGS